MRIVLNLISPVRIILLLSTLVIALTPHTSAAATVYKSKVAPHWFAGADGVTNQFWYRLDLPGSRREFVRVDAEAGRREPAFDHARAALALGKLAGKKPDTARLPVESIEFAPDGKSVTLHGTDTAWQLDLESYALAAQTNGVKDVGGLPVLRQPHPSRDSAVDTEITFENRLDGTVKLFWIDSSGGRVAYGSLGAGETRTQHTYAGHVWLVTSPGNSNVAVFEAEETPAAAIIDGRRPDGARSRRQGNGDVRRPASGAHSPDGKWEAVLHNDNLFLRESASGAETQLSTNAGPRDTFARDTENPAPEVFWSPDSKHLVALRLKPGAERKVFLVESSPGNQLQPKLISVPYLKPGDDVDVCKPHLFDVEAKKEIPVSDALFANPWSLDDVRWDADSARFMFLFNQRGHQALRVVAVDAPTGAARAIVDETNRTFVDYSGKFFCEHLDDSGEILWMSERDGWNHLYLYDAKTGAVKNQVTKGEWVVRSVDFVDHAKRQIWFQAGGIVPGQDPYFIQFCRVNFDGSGLTVLTEGDGTHTAQFSPDRKFLVDTWSRVNLPPVTELRRCDDGKLACKLETAEVDGKLPLPEPFVAKGRDGATDIYGVVWRPKDFDPHKKYPVVEDIYAGPQDSFTPKAFRTSYQQQKLADHGFIVVQMDGMGTANRSKAFHDVCWKNLRDAGFPDRIAWIRAAAKQFPAMDLSRVGIYGTSAGGQDALRGLLDHGDFYQAGVADSGCYDNRMDKIWWNEQWLGWPVDESYERSSCVPDAPKLRGKLLLLAGELDKNVDPASTMQVVNALVKADKDFELLIMPGMGHGVLSTDYGWHRLEDFFARNLGGPK